jgi:hypothetical protein
MNVRSIPVSGTGTTSAAGGPQPLIVLPQFPADGAWSVRGQITAFEAAKDRAHSFAFNVAVSGLTSGGVADETDGTNPPYTVAPVPAGTWAGLALTLAFATFPSGPVATIAATLPAAPAGAEAVNWTWSLEVGLSDA